MIFAYNSHWWAPDAWTLPRLQVCGGIQVLGGYWDLAPVEECGRGPCRGHQFLVDAAQRTAQCGTPEPTETHNGTGLHSTHQSSTRQRNASAHRVGGGTQRSSVAQYTPEEHARTRATQRSTQRSKAKQSSTPQPQWQLTATTHAANTDTSPTPDAQGGCYTHHAGNPPMHNQRRQQGTHARHHQRPTTPHPNANTAPRKTTKATRTHTTQKGCFLDALLGANTFPTTPRSGGSPNLSRGVARAGGWQPATRLTIGQRPKTCTARE